MESHKILRQSIEKLAVHITNFKNNQISKNQFNKQLFFNLSYLFCKLQKQKSQRSNGFYFPYLNLSYTFLNKIEKNKFKEFEEDNEDNGFEQSPLIVNDNNNLPNNKEDNIDNYLNYFDNDAANSDKNNNKYSSYNDNNLSMYTLEDIEADAKNELLFKKIESSNITIQQPKFFELNCFNNSSGSGDSYENNNYFYNSAELCPSSKNNNSNSHNRSNKDFEPNTHKRSLNRSNVFGSKKKDKKEMSKTTVLSARVRNHYNEIYFRDINKRVNQSIELWYENFGHLLSKKSIQFYHKKMNDIYINLMYLHYMHCDFASRKMLICQDKMFMNLIKVFILKIGICDKKLYEDILRTLVYKNSQMDFEKFMNCFVKILKFEDEFTLLKYKFLLCINKKDDNQKYLSAKDLQNFFKMINCDKKNEDINEDITTNLINFYSVLYKKENPKKFDLDKLVIILEYFFDNK